jgi:hypothetical protein
MTRILRLLPALLLLAACVKPENPPASPAQREAAEAGDLKLSTRLSEAIRGVHAGGPCSSVVAMEWPDGFPVPAEASQGRRFKIFFYPMSSVPGEPTFYSPAAEALLDIETGKVTSCELTGEKPKELSGRRWPIALNGVGAFPMQALTKKLHDRTEAVAAVYGSANAPTPAGVETAKDYIRLFKMNAEPSLLPYYYRLNPAFWEWLRATAGDSIPAAQ